MTIRQSLNRGKRWTQAMFFGGAVLAMLGSAAFPEVSPEWLAALPGGALCVAGLWFVSYRFRCPRCRGDLSAFAYSGLSINSIDRRIVCCPYCRADIDGDVAEIDFRRRLADSGRELPP